MCDEFPARRIWATVDKLLAEPLLPPHLDLALVEALPEKPAVYVMRGTNKEALRIGRAANLRREVKDYFRLDRISARAAQLAYKVRNIEWQASEGELAARLLEISLNEKEAAREPAATWAIRVDPAQSPIAAIVPADELVAKGQVPFGLYGSERKALNALSRLGRTHRLCHAVLGLDRGACGQCESNGGCAQPQHLVRALTALATLRLQPWPYCGPVGVREGRIVHVFDQWQWLGSARTAPELAELAGSSLRGFNAGVFAVLAKALPRLAARRVKTLRRGHAARSP